jgi:hypothetical protein
MLIGVDLRLSAARFCACEETKTEPYMKRKLLRAEAPLPKFRSDAEAAEYFNTHSVAEVWSQLPEGKPMKPSKALAKSVRERHKPGGRQKVI